MPSIKSATKSTKVEKLSKAKKEEIEVPPEPVDTDSEFETDDEADEVEVEVEAKKRNTEVQKMYKFVEALMEEFEIPEKKLLKFVKSKKMALPKSFPVKWGGKEAKPKDNKEKPDVKGHMSNFFFFKGAYPKENPDFKDDIPKGMSQVKYLSNIWNAMTEEEKQPYTDMALKDKKRYDREMMAADPKYKPSETKKAEKTDGPKRTNALIVFKNEKRAAFEKKYPKKDTKDINELLQAAWDELSDKKKESYRERARELNAAAGPRKLSEKQLEKERAKAADPENYILNKESGCYVKRESALGKKLAKDQSDDESSESEAEDDKVDLSECA